MWLGLAVVLDIMHFTSTGYYNRNRIPGYSGAQASAAP
jgi:hypothetical protein